MSSSFSALTSMPIIRYRPPASRCRATTVPNVMVVHPSIPARSLRELVALAKAHPHKLNFGSGGVGSGSQLGAELFKLQLKLDAASVPFGGAGPAIQSAVAGMSCMTPTAPAWLTTPCRHPDSCHATASANDAGTP